MMFGGQSIGMALSTALSGAAIAAYGPSAAYLLSALFIGLVTVFMHRHARAAWRAPAAVDRAARRRTVNLAIQARALVADPQIDLRSRSSGR